MKRILVIEVEDMLRNFIVGILHSHGFEAISVSEAQDGIKLYYEHGADLLICDVLLPGMSGFEVLEQLRSDPLNSLIPIILLTGKTDRADFRKGMELGADDFIPKPFTEEELLGAINAQLKKKELISSLQELGSYEPESHNETKPLPEEKKKLGFSDYIFLTVANQRRLFKVNTLKSISALGDYSNVITSDGKFIVRKPMKDWEEILPEKYFIRIHRSTIINIDFVEKIEKWLNRAYRVYIRNVPKPFIISRRYSSRIREKFS